MDKRIKIKQLRAKTISQERRQANDSKDKKTEINIQERKHEGKVQQGQEASKRKKGNTRITKSYKGSLVKAKKTGKLKVSM